MSQDSTGFPLAAEETGRQEPFSSPAEKKPADDMVTDDDFSESVAPLHLRLDASAYQDIYVVGDVHGCIDELRTLWDRLAPTDDDLVVFVGDLIRKGPDSRAVVEFIREQPNAYSVRGNNEAKYIHDRVDLPELDAVDEYIRNLPVAISWNDDLAVHGGIDPRRALSEHDIVDLLEFRAVPPENGYDGPFWFEAGQHEGPPRVFFGHTVLDHVVDNEWAVGLDTGCVYGGALTAYDYHADEFISVPAERTYRTRPDRKFVEA